MTRWLALCLALAAGSASAGSEMLPEADQPAWAAIGRVNIAGLKRRAMCTGTLVAADLVVTAAHCVFRGERLARAEAVHFVAGWRGGTYAAHRRAAEIRVDDGYRPGTADVARDRAVIRLSTPIPAEQVIPLPVAALPAIAADLTLIGYRRDRPHAPSRQAPCRVTQPGAPAFRIDCPVVPGASGGPVLWHSPEGWRVVGVVSAALRDGSGTLAARAMPLP